MTKDQLVWVKNNQGNWQLAHYAYLGDNGKHYCYVDACTEQQAGGEVVEWEFVKEAK